MGRRYRSPARLRTQEAREELASVESAKELAEVEHAFLLDSLAMTRSVLAELREMSPPDIVADEHAAFVDAYTAEQVALQGLVDDFEQLGCRRFAARFEQLLHGRIREGTREACADLQAVAERVNVDLGC